MSPLGLLAQGADKGRLPDGRAYRTDAEGYQLVDYIAELELKIEELQNKLISQDNEQRLAGSNGNFQEADLLSDSSESTSNDSVADCSLEVEPYKSQVASLQHSNESLTERVSSLNAQIQELGQDSESETLLVSLQDREERINDLEFSLKNSEEALSCLLYTSDAADE